MTFKYLNWAIELEGVSPVARLLAIWMGNYARPISGSPDAEKPAFDVDIDRALDWIGCEESELMVATGDLIALGVSPLRVVGRRIEFTFPEIRYEEPLQHSSRREARLSIYVITIPRRICSKVGISKFPRNRLAGLQASNPTERLQLIWSEAGTASVIRRVEREAHAILAPHSRGNEWFEVDAERAVGVVRDLLAKAGIAS